MKNKLLLALSFVLIAGVGWISGREVSPARPTWEYHASYSSDGQPSEDFNKLSADGWELATVSCYEIQCTYHFKRPR